jgi:hypothetical protein
MIYLWNNYEFMSTYDFLRRIESCVVYLNVGKTCDCVMYGGTGCYSAMCALSVFFRISLSNITFGLTVQMSFN